MFFLIFLLTVIVARPFLNMTFAPMSDTLFVPLSHGNATKQEFISIERVALQRQLDPSRGFSAAVTENPERNGRHVKQWRIQNCDTFTQAQMEAVVGSYPYVQVYCEAQSLILYPASLDGIQSSRFKYLPKLLGMLGTYYFREFRIKAVSNDTALIMPLALCLSFSNEQSAARTEVRLALSVSPRLGGSGTGGIPFPMFGINSGLGAELGVGGSVYVNHVCNRRQAAVRPFISIRVMNLTVSTRDWTVKMHSKKFIEKLKWVDENYTVMSRRAPIVSCVSELYVPGVCTWASRPIDGERLKAIRRRPRPGQHVPSTQNGEAETLS